MSGVLLAARARRRLRQFGRISAPLGFLITATSLIILNTAIAAGNPFKVTNAEIVNRSTGVQASIGSFSDTTISSDVTFYQLGDNVSYAVTLANTGSQDILINSIIDDNENSYISYSYDNHAGAELAAGDSLTLDIVTTYAAAIPDITARSQHLEVKFMIDYDLLEEELDVPDTGVNTRNKVEKHAVADPVVITFMVIGIILLIAGLVKSKVSIHFKALVLILLGTIASTSVIKAAGSQVAFEFVSDVDIKSLLSITYTVDNEEKTEVIDYGDTLSITDPEIPGYDFDGWVDENGDPVDPNTPIVDDITIAAVLTPRTDTRYTVYHELENLAKTAFVLDKTETFTGTTATEVTPDTIDYEGFTAPQKQTIVIKGDGTASVTYQYTRNTFDTAIDPTNVIITPANPETCAAGENPDNCDPNAPINPVNPDDPTAPVDPIDPDDPLPYGTKIVLTAKDIEHYTFDHWSSSDSAINNKADNPLVIIVTGPVDATPVYTGNPYTVTFNATSDEVSGTPTQASITVNYPALVGELPTVTNMTKIGYNFLGWYFEDDTTKFTADFQPTENVTVYAHYEHVDTNFIINHRWPESIDSATMTAHETEYVNCLVGDPILVSTHVKDYSPRAVVNSTSAAATPTCLEGGSYNLNYDWMLYSLQFSSNDYKGAASTTGSFPMDKQVTIAATERNNYTFDHWQSGYSTINNRTTATYTFAMPAENITDVTPIYRATVTFNPGEFAQVSETSRDIIEGNELGNLPAINNLDQYYIFDGWFTAPEGGDVVTASFVPAGNTTIYAHYTHKIAGYTVRHFKMTTAGTYNESPDEIDGPTVANVGISVSPAPKQYTGFDTPAATSLTITEDANANVVSYYYVRKVNTIVFNNNDARATGATAGQTVRYGDTITLNENGFELTGYAFAGWATSADGNVAYDDQDDFVGTAEGGEYELFAKWTPNTFTVIFHANSDEVSNPTAMTDQVVTYDETTTLTPNVYEREHYKLMGWATSENGDKVYNDGADITNVISENNGELNLYAVWRERTAMLSTGSNVNTALKAVNTDATTFTHYTGTPELDTIENKRDIALTTSNFPVYIWDDNGTIYWWSEAENVYMNADSGSMFKGTNFVSIDASGFDASTATNMQLMFIDTRNVENINISGWDTSNVTSMYAMFNRAGVNKEDSINVDLTELDVQNVLSFDQMFKETKFVTLDLSSWNVESVTNTRSMFSSMPNLTTLNISGFDLSGLGDTPLMLFQSNNPSVISNSLLTSPETITMDNVIFNKNMDRLFENQSKLTTLSINNIDTSRTTSMQSMFSGAWNLAALDATQFNTANVTNMYRMFTNANKITSLDVSGWDVSKVTDMDHMFDMSNLTSIDLSTWNTQSLAVIKGLFDYARNLETIYVGENFNITNASVQNSSMFRENTKLVGGAGTAFNVQMTNSGKTHGRIDEPCDGRPGLFTLRNSQYICFYANDGTDVAAGQYVVTATPSALRANTFTRENYVFDGWNTEPDGTGSTSFTNEGVITVATTSKTPIRLYAKWKESNAMLQIGTSVKNKIRDLASSPVAFEKYTGTPNFEDIQGEQDIALATSNLPVYVWYDAASNKVFWWSQAETVYMNPNSGSMFSETSFVSIDVSGFDASTATSMAYMFKDARDVETINITGWDTSNVTMMLEMFNRAGVNKENPVNVDLAELDVENVQSFNQMFKETKFISMDLSGWNVESVVDTKSMFSSMPNLTTLNISGFDLSGLGSNKIALFDSNNPSVVSNSLRTSPTTVIADNVVFNENMSDLFYSQVNLTEVSLAGVDTSRTTSMNRLLQLCTSLTSVDLRDADFENVTDMSGMFAKDSNLETVLFADNINTGNVTTMAGMFNEAEKLSYVDVSHFNTSNVTNMLGMFRFTPLLTTVDVSHFDTSKLEGSIESLFSKNGATELDLSTFDTSRVTVMRNLFLHNTAITTIYASDQFVTTLVPNVSDSTDGHNLFYNTPNLVGGAGTAFTSAKHTEYARIDDPCNGKPGFFTLKNSQYICFYVNDGSNTTAGQYIPANTLTALRANTFMRDEYDLVGWNTAADGTGELTFEDAEPIMVSSEYITEHFKTPIKLYAQWKRKSHTITFHPNMDGVTGEMATQTATHGTSPWLRANTYTKDHWRFLGWTTEPSENIIGDGDLTAIDYANNATIRNVTTDIDLYAKWVYRCRTFATDSWDTIISKVEADQNYYDAGDFCEKEIEMDADDDNVMETYTIRLANTTSPAVCSTEGYSQTACGIVIEFANVIKPVTMNATTVGGWKESQVAAWLNNEFYDKLPSELKNIIIPTYPIVSGPAYQGYSDDITKEDFNINKIYLFTGYEAGGKEGATNWDIKDNPRTDTRVLDHYTGLSYEDYSDSRIKKDLEGNAREWWLRNACNYSSEYFGYMSARGRYSCGNAVFERWLAPAFRIGRKLTVSFNAGEGGVASEATRDYLLSATSYGTLPTITTTPENHAFLGWYTEANGGDKIESTSQLTSTSNHTLYARYRDISAEFAKLKNGKFNNAITAFTGNGATIKNIVPGTYPAEWYLTGCGESANCYEMQADDSPYKVVAWYDENNSENMNLYYAAEYDKNILLPLGGGYMFGYSGLETVDMALLDGREMKNAGSMIRDYASMKSVILGENFNSYNTTQFDYAFSGTTSLTNLDIANIKTDNATSLYGVFGGSNLSSEQIAGVSNWNVSNVTNYASSFYGMQNLTTIDLSSWQTSDAVTSYVAMFALDHHLTTVNITGLKTNASTNITSMFNTTERLTTIIADTNFDGSAITKENAAKSTFEGCDALVGGNNTAYANFAEDSDRDSGIYARIDDPAHGRPGYFTLANPLVVTFDDGSETSTYNYIPSTDYGTLPTITNAPADQVFLGWYTAAEGGAKVNDNDTFVSDNAHTLYARYAYTTTIAFHANYEGATETMESQIAPQGVEIQLNANEFSMRDLYKFDHWSVTADGTGTTYANGANITLPAVGPGVTVDLYAQWAERNAIVYHANGEGVDGVMPITYANYSGTFHLQPSDYSRAGYGFAGWSLEADGSETMYGPMQTVDLEGLGIKNLYAQWIAPTGTLQNFNCANLESGAKVALTDNRDGQVYTVAKLADGKCWTTENLRLGFSNLASGVTIDSSNTNNPSADFTARISSNPTSDEWSDGGNSVAAINRLNYNTTNIERGDEDARYSYGVYYNWYTATAGQGTFDSQEEDAQGDICPAGWRLPIGATGYTGTHATGGDYSDLKDAMNIPDEASDWRWRQYPLNFIHSGYVERDGDEDVITWRVSNTLISAGEYWTSSAHQNSNLFSITMRVHDNHYDVNGQQHKAKGFTVRCVNTSTHSLTLDTNDGTSHTLTQTGTSDNGDFVFTLPNYEPTRDGYEFAGWSTSPSATTADYQPGDNITATTANTTLYAVWVQPVTYTTTFNVGEGATLVGDATVTGVSTTGSYTFTLPSATKSGWGLVGWDTTAGVISPAYQAGGEFTTSTENNTLYAIWEETCPSGNVCYYNNDGTGTIMQMHAVVAQERFNLASPSALREGYAFGGWSEWRGGTSPYGPNEKTFAPYDTWKLYAIWIQSSGTMQNWTGCNDLSTNETIALTDSRDGQIYTVARLHNDQCWMTANLRLNLATHGDQVNSTNTNNPTAGFLTTVNAKPASSTTWCNTDNKTCTEQVLYNSDNITDTTNSTHYLGGVYYNWFTATAGNGTYNLDGATVSGDICPAGWRLPANSDSNSEIYYLYQNRSHRPVLTPTYYPFMLPQEGYYDGNSVVSRGTGGFAWGSTAGYHTAVYLGEENGEVNNWNKKPQYDGLSVRCLAK